MSSPEPAAPAAPSLSAFSEPPPGAPAVGFSRWWLAARPKTLPAAATPGLQILNASGQTIVAIGARPSDSRGAWRDVLRNATIGEGRETRIDPGIGDECVFDLAVDYADGTDAVLREVDFCDGADVTVFRVGYAQ